MKQVAQDISAMSDEELNTYIASFGAEWLGLSRKRREASAKRLEAYRWDALVPYVDKLKIYLDKSAQESKPPPESPALVWFSERASELSWAGHTHD